MGREVIETIIIASHEVREDGTRDDGILMLQLANQLLHIILWVETETVHTCIQLDVNREAGDTLLLCCLNQGIEDAERINLWLQVVIKHGLEGSHLWVHNHNVAGDTTLAKGDALIGNSHSQVIDTMVLQGLGNLYRSCTVTIRLDHTNQLGLWLHERTIIVEVGYHGIEVDLQGRLVYLLHQKFGQLVETKLASTLQEDNLVAKALEHLAIDKLLHIAEEELFGNLNFIALLIELRTHADELDDATLAAKVGHLFI